MSKMSVCAALLAGVSMGASPAIAKDSKAYEHAIECSSAVAVVAALVEGDPETADIAHR